MIIDAHLHLNDKFDGTAHGAATELSRQLKESDVERGIVLHLEAQSWSAEEFSEAISPHSNLRGFINIHPNKSNANLLLRDGIEKLGFIGLKLHPRLQEFGVDDEETVHLVQAAGEMNIPVLIDAFPKNRFNSSNKLLSITIYSVIEVINFVFEHKITNLKSPK